MGQNERLASTVALISGAAEGIGAGIARAFVAEGARVMIADVQTEKAAALAAELGTSAAWVELDVTSPEAWGIAVSAVLSRFGALTSLVNNAGIGRFCTLDRESLDDWRRVQAVNTESMFLGAQAALPYLAAQPGSSIVNIGSNASLTPWYLAPAYCVSKAGVLMLTKCIAQHCLTLELPVRCNAILPGPTRTPMFESLAPSGVGDIDIMQDFNRRHAHFALGDPTDIAEAAVYLASGAARNVNGTSMLIDGGGML
jgi:3(or 17)beta-hydroxysteroid dehydrogenase